MAPTNFEAHGGHFPWAFSMRQGRTFVDLLALWPSNISEMVYSIAWTSPQRDVQMISQITFVLKERSSHQDCKMN